MQCCGLEGDPHSGTPPPPAESPAPCALFRARGCHTQHSALPSAEAPGRPPSFTAVRAQGARWFCACAEEQRQPGRAVSHGGPAVRGRGRGAGLSRSSWFSPPPGRDASRGCGVRTQHSAHGAPRTPPRTEAMGRHQLAPHARPFTFLKFLEPFPSRSAPLAGQHPHSSPASLATPGCILSWATA